MGREKIETLSPMSRDGVTNTMTTHQLDIIMTRIESIEFALASLLIKTSPADEHGARAGYSWIDTDGHIKEPRDLVREKALEFDVMYDKWVKRNEEQLAAVEAASKARQQQ